MAMETILQTETNSAQQQEQQQQQQQQRQTEIIDNNKINSPSQLSSISLMLEYEIDNTLNTIKENSHILSKMIQVNNDTSHRIGNLKLDTTKKLEINNNNNSHNDDDEHNKSLSKCPESPDSGVEGEYTPSPISSSLSSSSVPLSQQSDQQCVKTNARKRWKILAKVLRKDSSEESVQDNSNSSNSSSNGGGGAAADIDDDDDDENVASVRRFKSFDLLRQDSLDDTTEINILNKPENWYTYKIQLNNNCEYSVNIHHIERHFTANDLMGFNNTGNICVWPSEEALTVYVLSNLQQFCNKWILELGGGMTCLAGLMLAKYSNAYLVHLTDGNEVSMENVRRTLCLNKLSCYTKYSVLKWEDIKSRLNSDYEKFDYILSADCLFFDDARLSLIDTIWYYLSINGLALIMAPKRGKTLNIFLDECLKKGFQYQLLNNYSDVIWKRHLELLMKKSNLYDEDIHYPILVKLNKIKKLTDTGITNNTITTTTTGNIK